MASNLASRNDGMAVDLPALTCHATGRPKSRSRAGAIGAFIEQQAPTTRFERVLLGVAIRHW